MTFRIFCYIYFHKSPTTLSLSLVIFNPNIFLKKKLLGFFFYYICTIMKNFEVKLPKIRFDYEFLETIDAGIELKGIEVKSVKKRNFSFIDAYCYFKDGELFVKNLVINDVDEPKREKKLLLKKQELNKLEKELIKGLTIVPYKFFANDKGRIKCTIVLARRNKNYEKKQKLKEKDLDREKKLED